MSRRLRFFDGISHQHVLSYNPHLGDILLRESELVFF